jgi:hypothetical protein
LERPDGCLRSRSGPELVRGVQGLCCVPPSCGRLKPQSRSVSDRLGKLVKRDRQPPGRWLLDRQLVVPSTNVLDKGMARDDHPGAAVSLEASHRPQPGLEASVIGLDVVVGIPLSAMPRRWQQLLQHHRIRRCLVGYDFAGSGPGRAERLLEEPTGGLASRHAETNTSMTCPNWSIARYT